MLYHGRIGDHRSSPNTRPKHDRPSLPNQLIERVVKGIPTTMIKHHAGKIALIFDVNISTSAIWKSDAHEFRLRCTNGKGAKEPIEYLPLERPNLSIFEMCQEDIKTHRAPRGS